MSDRLSVKALTPALWPALEELFGPRGACGGCWCMYFRVGSAYRRRPAARNKAAFRQVVRRGPPPGLLAFLDGRPVGWCQLTPRSDLPALDRLWRLRAVDDVPVWVISCFYIRIGHRRQGITRALILGAIKSAKRAKAAAIEAFPLDGRLSPSASSCGYASTFASAGFQEVARRSKERPIMRIDFRKQRG